MLGLRAMQQDIKRQRKKALNIKIFFTVCVFGIVAFIVVAKDPDFHKKLMGKITTQQIAELDNDFVSAETGSTYSRAAKLRELEDLQELERLAQEEARKIMASGDISTLERELRHNKLLNGDAARHMNNLDGSAMTQQ